MPAVLSATVPPGCIIPKHPALPLILCLSTLLVPGFRNSRPRFYSTSRDSGRGRAQITQPMGLGCSWQVAGRVSLWGFLRTRLRIRARGGPSTLSGASCWGPRGDKGRSAGGRRGQECGEPTLLAPWPGRSLRHGAGSVPTVLRDRACAELFPARWELQGRGAGVATDGAHPSAL